MLVRSCFLDDLRLFSLFFIDLHFSSVVFTVVSDAAVENGDMKTVKILLDSRKCDISAKDLGLRFQPGFSGPPRSPHPLSVRRRHTPPRGRHTEQPGVLHCLDGAGGQDSRRQQ